MTTTPTPEIGDKLFQALSGIQGRQKIQILLMFLEETGGMLEHFKAIDANGFAGNIEQQKQEYVKVRNKITSLILQEYDSK